MGTRRGSWRACYALLVRLRFPRLLCSSFSWLSTFLLPFALCLLLPSLVFAQEIRYLYDDLGRLVGVVDPQGNAAAYEYDSIGNLLQVRRFNVDPAANVAISLVSPNKGTVGTVVQIFGKGFSPTPGANQVTFNGVAATVTASTAISLTTTVPSGATTGPITVTVSLVGSATSPESFTVLQTFAVVPDQVDVALGGAFGFQATLDGTPTSAVTWRVSGVVGGNSTLGTITAAGVYTAPSALPPVSPLTIEAVLTADPTQIATATLRVVGQAAGLIAAAPVTVRRADAITAQAAAGPVTVGVIQPTAAQAISGSVTVGVIQPAAAQAAAGPVTVGVIQAAAAQALSGPLTVGVTPSLGAMTLSGPLTLTGGPVVTAVAPASGTVGSTLPGVTITGVNLQGSSGIQAIRNGLIDSTVTASAVTPAADGTTVTFTLTIGTTAPVGLRVLRVVTPQGTSTVFDIGTNIFTVTP